MSQREFTVPLFIYDDGRLAVHGSEIRGLVIEVDTFDEVREELLRLVPALLRSNHGLTEEEIAHVSLCVSLRDMEEDAVVSKPCAPHSPKLFWEDNPNIVSVARA